MEFDESILAGEQNIPCNMYVLRKLEFVSKVRIKLVVKNYSKIPKSGLLF